MKLSILKEMLAMVGAIIKTNGSSVNRCSVPSFFGVLVEIDDKKLHMTGAGIGGERITVSYCFGDEQVQSGKTIICYTGLSRVLSSRVFKDGEVTLSFDKALIIAQHDPLDIDKPTTAKIPLFEYAEDADLSHISEPMPADQCRLKLMFDKKKLAQALSFVVPFAAKNDFRCYLSAACLNVLSINQDMTKAAIEAVSTDGHRMGFQRLEAEINHFDADERSEVMRSNMTGDVGENIILPYVLAGHLASWLSKKSDDDSVGMAYGLKGDVDFSFDVKGLDVRLLFNTIDGKYPDYRRVFCKPEVNTVTITLRREAIERQLRMLNALYFDRAKYFGVKLAAKDGFLTVAAPQDKEKINALAIPYQAEFHDTKSAVNWIAGFNLNYLLDVLKSEKDKDFYIRIAPNDADSRVSIECKALNGFLVIMPMRI